PAGRALRPVPRRRHPATALRRAVARDVRHRGLPGGHDRVHREASSPVEGSVMRARVASDPMPVAATSGEPRRSPKWQARRQAIIDTSATVFARGGYHATGITELCAANDLGKGALYHYIGSKEALLAAIHDRVMDEVILCADRVAAAGGSPSDQLAMLGEE